LQAEVKSFACFCLFLLRGTFVRRAGDSPGQPCACTCEREHVPFARRAGARRGSRGGGSDRMV